MIELSVPEARRLVLGAQGFDGRRPADRVGLPQLRRILRRTNLFQIDSVNVLVRAHYMPLYSRLGPYRRDLLDEAAYRRRELFEYWGHGASFMPVEWHPLFRWHMDLHHKARWTKRANDERYVKAVLAEVTERGPISAAQLSEPGERSGPWWGWGDGKATLEWLTSSGRLAVAGRRNFERLYDLTERVIPKAVLDAPTPSPDDAKRQLLVLATRALGVSTVKEMVDHFSLDPYWFRPVEGGKRVRSTLPSLVADLVEDGRLVPVKVEGWRQAAYMHPDAKVPRAHEGHALLSPFDPVMWDRKKVLRLFGFDYKIEIYVPEPKRRFGYYVLPFLSDEALVARVDLKADRKASALLVRSAFAEPRVPRPAAAAKLAGELRTMADWLGLEHVVVERRGDLAGRLRTALA